MIMDKLTRIRIEGFKSFRKIDQPLRPINVLIGANGSGKSNFISFFKMLNYMATGSMQDYIAVGGFSNSFLYYGSKFTPQLSASLDFTNEKGETNFYSMRLSDAAPDTLIFVDETVNYQKSPGSFSKPRSLGAGHKETLLNEKAEQGDKTADVVGKILRRCRVFQFHDTSENARVRKGGRIIDNRYFRSDGGNLAAYLYMLRKTSVENYKRIVSTIKFAAPHFGDFVLEPEKLNPDFIMLNWKENGSDYLFGPHQLPDGLLRFMSLVTLLLQPKDGLPNIIIIDEPELGLHPAAINLLGGLLREITHHYQIIIATQSLNLLDQFEPSDVMVIERKKIADQIGFESEITRLDPGALESWREEYTLSELWQKNLLGGRPR